MSVLRGFLRLSLTRLTKLSRRSQSVSYALLVVGLFVMGLLLIQSKWASQAAWLSTKDDNAIAQSEKKVASSGNNSSVVHLDDPIVAIQGCTVNCNATVPATGQVNAAVNFAATATTNGCPTQPTFDWNFGDGSAQSSLQNPSHTYTAAGSYNWTLTTTVGSGSTMIDTIAGGLGEGNLAMNAPFGTLIAVARDPQNRGIYVADVIGGVTLIRFFNTSNSTVTIAGRSIESKRVRAIAGGGLELGDNVSGLISDLGVVSGLDTSADGNLLYFVAQIDKQVRALNVSSNTVTVAGLQIGSGNIGTLASGFGEVLNGIAVNDSTGDVYVADATAGVNRVYRITANGTATAVAGNGAVTRPEDAFVAGAALNTPLLQPRAVELDSSGRLLIADTGHGRVIRVESNGNATLVTQFTVAASIPNPFPSGMSVQGNNIYIALGNSQTIVRTNGGVTVAGQNGQSCDYSVSSCGDGGPGTGAAFNLLGSTGNPPLAGIACDSNGVFILDQGITGRGRIRYLNTSGGSVSVAGVTISAGAIDRIGGNGLTSPYDGGLATSATFNTPTGVAVDANGNLWISDTISARLRFVNRGTSSVKIFTGTASEQTVPAGAIVTVNRDVGQSMTTDGVPVIQAGFESPQGLFITSQGIFLVDSKSGPTVPMQANGRDTSTLRFINTSNNTVVIFPGSASPVSIPPGNIAKIAGGGETLASNGDGGFALAAKFIGASDVVVDGNGNIFMTDTGQNAVRRINGNTGVVNSILTGKQYTGLGIGPDGRIYVANYTDGSVLRETSAGSGSFSNLATGFNKPRDVAVGSDNTAYVTVGPAPNVIANNQIVQISSTGTATVIAGSVAGFSGDGGPATSSRMNISPSALVVGSGTSNQLPETVNIVVSSTGEIIFTDSNNNRIRRISSSTVTCTKTGTITIQGDNPVPALTSISPNSALQGSGAFTLTVNGSGFVPASVVRWNGQNRTTTFVSNSQLTASILAGDLTNAGTANVTVFNGAPGGGTSNSLVFTVSQPNPVPVITSLSPNTAVENSAGFLLTVNGNNFVNGSVVRWDGQNRQTTFVSATQLTAQILASDLQGTGQASVTVFNPAPGGGTSNVGTFNITSGQNPAPTLTGINPNSATAGAAAFVLTATGTNFVASSKVRWNGQDLSTTFVSATQLTAQVTANLIANAGTAQVTVFTPTPGGGVTTALNFTINAAQIPITTVSAASFLGNDIAPESIVAGFGVNLATGVEIASTVPLPTTLLGTKVTVKDSAGTSRNAALFFVAPTQINYQVPPGTATGNAMVTVTINNNVVATGSLNVTTVAPGLFSANSSGLGVAAADILRVRNGVQIYEIASRFDQATGQFVPVQVDLGPEGDLVYVLLYGVGMRARSSAGNISVTINGSTRALNPNNFEDAFGVAGFVGLDQVNVLLSRSLIGAGLINVSLTVDGKPSNTVQLLIK
ncbi:MAG: PKD domain-containing protein [Blastocatellales bacterium]